MSVRSLLYWLICLVFAFFMANAAEPNHVEKVADWAAGGSALQAKLLPVPEPGRAMLLFAGIMAMAFTYRRAWLNWRSEV